MKKIFSVLLTFLLVLSLFAPASLAAPKDVSIEVNGENILFDELKPLIAENYTWAPKAPLFLALGIEDEDLSIEYDTLAVGSNHIYVKVREIAEAFGHAIQWEPSARKVIIKTASNGYIWKTQHSGNTVYLVGSLHVANDSFYPLKPAIESAFAEADYLGVEVDITKTNTPEAQQFMLKLSTYQDGTTLKDHISPESYEKLTKILQENGLPENAMDVYKPWMVQNVLTVLQAASIGYDSQSGIDLYFMTKALELGIPIVELESLEFQLNMLSGFPEDLQKTLLSDLLENFHDTEALSRMGKMWKDGDDASLHGLLDEFKKYDELYYNAMIRDRNIGMVEKLETYLNSPGQEVYFIVVGAAHMVGEHGVVQLLEDKGYEVERL